MSGRAVVSYEEPVESVGLCGSVVLRDLVARRRYASNWFHPVGNNTPETRAGGFELRTANLIPRRRLNVQSST